MRVLLSLCLSVFATAAVAVCEGNDYFARLSLADRAQIDAAVAETPFPRGLVWEATRGDDNLTVVGTIHIHDPRLSRIMDRVADRVSAAELLLVEAGPEEEAAMTRALSTQPDLILITEGPTLPEQLDPDVWERLVAAAEARSIPGFMLAKFQPWYVALTLSIPSCALQDIAGGMRGLDHLLIETANHAGVPVQAVEPWDTLFSVMRSGTPEEQIEALQLSLLDPALQSDMYVGMLNAYFDEEIAAIWEGSRVAAKEADTLDPARAAALFEETEKLILTDRNLAWMPVIEDAADAHDTIVLAVGAAHLPGEQGVLNLLAAAGWVITPLP